jgi:hypothetical protein
LKLDGSIITASPTKRLINLGVFNNSTLQAVLYLGSGGGVKKTISKDNDHKVTEASVKAQIRMTMQKTKLTESASRVCDEAKKFTFINEIEEQIKKFLPLAEKDPSKALMQQALTLDQELIKEILKTVHESTAGNMEDKVKKISWMFFGQNMIKAHNLANSFNSVVDSGEAIMVFSMLKATSEQKYSLKAFNTMLEKVLAYKTGSSSSSSMNDASVEDLATSLSNMSVGSKS